MKTWKALCTGLVAAASLSPNLWSQVPAVPGAPGVPGAPAATPVGGLHAFLGLTPEAKDAKRRRLCSKPFGQFLVQAMKPLSVFSGGILGNLCPPPNLEDTNKPGAEGAANKIKKDEAEAKARRAAVRYLGTVDCHFWPEAEKELIASLRGDRNECVRWEAAMALGGGCCCTKRTMEALLISATGSDKDGNPAETCERVRASALASLQRCLACFSEETAAEPKKPEKPEAPAEKPEKTADLGDHGVKFTAYYKKLDSKPMAQIVKEARQASTEVSFVSTSPITALPSGSRGIVNIVASALGVGAPAASTPASSEMQNAGIVEQAPTISYSPVGNGTRHSILGIDTSEPVAVTPPTIIKPAVTLPVEIKPIGSAPVQATQPVEIKPVEVKPTQPAHVKPVEYKPVEMKPTQPVQVKPVDYKPVEMKPTQPVQAKPVDYRPVEMKPTQPVQVKPVDYKPVEMKPTQPVQVKPVDYRPLEMKPVQPVQVKPIDYKPVEMKPVQPVQVKPIDYKPLEMKPTQPVSLKPVEVKPIEMKPAVAAPTSAVTFPSRPQGPDRLPPAATPVQTQSHGPASNPQQLLQVLRNSIYPFQREWAVDNLANVDWRSNPEVVQALLTAARKDPAPTVRIMCIRSLVKMKIDTVPVVTVVQSLRADTDPRVSREADQALAHLGSVPAGAATPIQPVSLNIPVQQAHPPATRSNPMLARPAGSAYR